MIRNAVASGRRATEAVKKVAPSSLVFPHLQLEVPVTLNNEERRSACPSEPPPVVQNPAIIAIASRLVASHLTDTDTNATHKVRLDHAPIRRPGHHESSLRRGFSSDDSGKKEDSSKENWREWVADSLAGESFFQTKFK